MKLYHHPASPNSRVVRLAARLLQQPLEEVQLDALKGEHQQPAYLAVNPNGLWPTLVDGDFVLWETVAILHYLCERSPQCTLLPVAATSRAEVIRWQAWHLAHWAPALKVFIFENVFRAVRGLGETDTQAVERNLPTFHKLATILEQRLSKSPWLAGPAMTLADLSVASYLMYADVARMPLADYGAIRRWFDRIASLPEWRDTEPSW
jgi:glutathione S-transferase